MDAVDVDFLRAGSGPRVILVHSSVAGARQWRTLMERLADQFELIAIRLHGYGRTEAWPDDREQRLEDQARLLEPFVPQDAAGEVSIVGHSYGGSVAMKAAQLHRGRVRRLVLIEPNPFYLLAQHGRLDAFAESRRLCGIVKDNGRRGTWETAAREFADYWTGPGSWEAMPPDRRRKFAARLAPNFHEWDGVMNAKTPLSTWANELPRDTTVISAADTARSIAEIVALMQEHVPHWRYVEIEHGGHMAALTHPHLVNPKVEAALV
jgi:pimeloyl-ACP methyl ester carboxylesterase